MTTFTRSYVVNIDAPIHDVFEYCRDPRHLCQGWPEIEVSEVSIKPDGLGTTAHIVGTFGRGLIVQDEDINWLEDLVDLATASLLNKNMNTMLAAIKSGVEADGDSPQ